MFNRLLKSIYPAVENKPSNITAIVVNYHTSQFLAQLCTVLNHEPEIDKIVVADNSNETGLHILLAPFHKVQLAQFKENIGFGAAINRVAGKHPSNYYLIINPDTLPDEGFCSHLLETAEKYNALITAPRFFWDETKIFRLPPAMGYSWKIDNDMHLLESNETDARLIGNDWILRHEWFWNSKGPFSEPFISGACMLIRNDRDFFTNGKIFDERFFLYYEDTDLCFSALLENRTILVDPKAEVVHYWDQSPSASKGKLMEESRIKFLMKHYAQVPEIYIPSKISATKAKIIDVGIIASDTAFTVDENDVQLNLFFEIGLNSHFVPFAQAEMKGQLFEIPESIINRLKPGEYFFRVRNSLNQTLKTWKWKKL